MKTRYFAITVISSGGFAIITYLLFTIGVFDQIIFGSANTSLNVSQLANDTASKYGIFPQETDWYVHVTSDGKIHPADNLNHKIYENSPFSCLFTVIPNDAKDHFVYLSVFQSNSTGYVVALDDQTGQIVDAKSIQYDSAICG